MDEDDYGAQTGLWTKRWDRPLRPAESGQQEQGPRKGGKTGWAGSGRRERVAARLQGEGELQIGAEEWLAPLE